MPISYPEDTAEKQTLTQGNSKLETKLSTIINLQALIQTNKQKNRNMRRQANKRPPKTLSSPQLIHGASKGRKPKTTSELFEIPVEMTKQISEAFGKLKHV